MSDTRSFERSAAAFSNPDHVSIVVHNYRWRLGLAEHRLVSGGIGHKLPQEAPEAFAAAVIDAIRL